MEKDDEHTQGIYTTFFRGYDARIGKWMSVDPKTSKTPEHSPYFSMRGNPIKYNDPKGDFVVVDDFIVGVMRGLFSKKTTPLKQGVRLAKNSIKIWKGLFSSDKNRSGMHRAGVILSRHTSEAAQTWVGFTVAGFINLFANPEIKIERGATNTSFGKKGSDFGFTIGSFVFGGRKLNKANNPDLRIHEFGHVIQSRQTGPLYLFGVALPSLIRAGNLKRKERQGKHTKAYDKFYTEKWAEKSSKNYEKKTRKRKKKSGKGPD
jgi:RHS repeat-associated protein